VSWGTALRLAATGGRADGTRIALTALGAALGTVAMIAAVTVAVTGEGDGPYTSDLLNQSGLHPGIVAGLVLLCLPVLAFVGQCARVGAPARDRRLAALRLQGATPAEVARVAAGETALSAGIGALAGTGLFFLLRALLADPVVATYGSRREIVTDGGGVGVIIEEITGPALRLPTDVAPPWPAVALIALGLPVVAGLFTVLALRRVTLSPFGVVRHEQPRPARVLPAMLFLLGCAGLTFFAALRRLLPESQPEGGVVRSVVLLLFLATGAGLLLGTQALSVGIGRLLATRTGYPSLILAGRRLLASPGQSARAHATLLLVVLLWAFAQGVRVWLLAGVDAADVDFYADALALVDLAFGVGAIVTAAGLLIGTVESTLTRRRVLAGLTAVGTPRGVLYRAVLVETLAPLLPTVLLATTAGILAARGVLGTTVQRFGAAPETLPVPWPALGALTVGTLLAVLTLTLVTLPLLRRSTSPAELRAA
jgi:hypothetical protein